MTLKVRRILSLIFIIFFLIITPAIVLYAAGYRLGRNGFSVQRTGMFIIESKPKGAKILLNGKTQKTLINSLFNKNSFVATPAKIKNLLPGEYDLSLELNGYFSWQKKLTINPGASTFAKDIYLFKNSPPVQIAPAKIEAISFSPDKNRALIISTDRLTFLNLSSETEESASQNNLKGKNIVWSLDGQRLIIDNYLYRAGDLNSKIDLNKLTPSPFNFKWDDDILFYQDKTSLYRLDGENLPKKIVNKVEFSDYLVKDGYLYLINQSKQNTNLRIINLASSQQIKDIGLPATAHYSFINSEQPLLNLYDNDHKILYLIDPLTTYYQPLVEIINNIKTAFWHDNDNLIYTNDFEIWLYNLESKKKTLITRISDTINNAVMHPNKNYIIYSTSQTINAIELNDREKRNITELAKLGSINSFSLNSKGDLLYFSGKVGASEGLYKLLIQ